MPRPRRWIVRLLVAAFALVPIAAVAAYAWNPFRADSLDPRQRILGIGLYRVPSLSMSPTLAPGRIIADRGMLSAGDVVTIRSPASTETQLPAIVLTALDGPAVCLLACDGLGEAVKNLSAELTAGETAVPWRLIAGTRDRLIHAYFSVDLDAVWSMVEQDLPTLRLEVSRILEG